MRFDLRCCWVDLGCVVEFLWAEPDLAFGFVAAWTASRCLGDCVVFVAGPFRAVTTSAFTGRTDGTEAPADAHICAHDTASIPIDVSYCDLAVILIFFWWRVAMDLSGGVNFLSVTKNHGGKRCDVDIGVVRVCGVVPCGTEGGADDLILESKFLAPFSSVDGDKIPRTQYHSIPRVRDA